MWREGQTLTDFFFFLHPSCGDTVGCEKVGKLLHSAAPYRRQLVVQRRRDTLLFLWGGSHFYSNFCWRLTTKSIVLFFPSPFSVFCS
jgi:hypothetical protein